MARPRIYDRDHIRDLVEQGKTTRQIADDVGAPIKTIRHILADEGLVAALPRSVRGGERTKTGVPRDVAGRAERANQVERMRRKGMSHAEIAETLGISVPLVGHAAGSLQSAGRLPPPHRSLGYTLEQRQAIIRFMREQQGLTFREIAEAWGLSMDHVAKTYRADAFRRE